MNIFKIMIGILLIFVGLVFLLSGVIYTINEVASIDGFLGIFVVVAKLIGCLFGGVLMALYGVFLIDTSIV